LERYKNFGGDSNVIAYETSATSITVEFGSGRETVYLYNEIRPGIIHVNQMKILAAAGRGLNSYIGQNCRGAGGYFSKR
jgi:hypothetical protein